MSDPRLGRTARALRHRLGLTQREVGSRSGTSQNLVSRIERGRIDGVTVGRLRTVLAVLDAELDPLVRWRGGEIDRLLDRTHAALGETTANLLERRGWLVMPEVSFSVFGERGSIDLLAFRPGDGRLLVVELKSQLTSLEELLRRHDAKTRLARKVAEERFAWRARVVIRLLVLPDERTAHRHVERHARLLAGPYPLRSHELRRWLSTPTRNVQEVGGILFLSLRAEVRGGRRVAGRRRVAGVRPNVAKVRDRSDRAAELVQDAPHA